MLDEEKMVESLVLQTSAQENRPWRDHMHVLVELDAIRSNAVTLCFVVAITIALPDPDSDRPDAGGSIKSSCIIVLLIVLTKVPYNSTRRGSQRVITFEDAIARTELSRENLATLIGPSRYVKE